MSIAPVSGPGSSGEPAPSIEVDRWQVQPGDTLCGIARALQQQGMPGTVAGLVRELARLNRLSNPDRIEVGQLLQLPVRAMLPGPDGSPGDRVESAAPGWATPAAPLRAEERRALLEEALLRLRAAWTDHPGGAPRAGEPGAEGPRRSPDGTPLFRQGDPAWREERLGVEADGPTLAHAGCAVTACAMALSRLSGQVLTPDALLRHLRENGGFQGALVDWSRAGTVAGGRTRAVPVAFDRATADRELDAGRPVLLRVLHDVQGGPRQHWICLTGRDARSGSYSANDPATGRTTALVSSGAGLVSAGGEPVRYVSDARMVTFATDSGRRAG
jgi:hypothetical protein